MNDQLPPSPQSLPDFKVLKRVVRQRRTEKVLGDLDTWAPLPEGAEARHQPVVREAILAAGWAPFHYPRNVDGKVEPWRAHVLWHADAKRAGEYLRDVLACTTKEPQLAAGCGAMILVTWLPESLDPACAPTSPAAEEARAQRDEEHLAAASAMVQNLLLLLTAGGMGTYWSSGGKLKSPEMFDHLGIDPQERLLAAVFVAYPQMNDGPHQRVPGKLRDRRGDGWVREVQL